MTPHELMAQMESRIAEANGAVRVIASTSCPTCHAPTADCICDMIGIVNAIEPSVIDGAMYDGRPKPAMVVKDDEGWRKI